MNETSTLDKPLNLRTMDVAQLEQALVRSFSLEPPQGEALRRSVFHELRYRAFARHPCPRAWSTVKTILINITERGPDLNMVIKTFHNQSSTERELDAARNLLRIFDETIRCEVSIDITHEPAKEPVL